MVHLRNERTGRWLHLERVRSQVTSATHWAAHHQALDAPPLSRPLFEGAGDTVTLHQVLHYLPAPEAAIGELARIIKPGGRLLIVDFAPHGHEELRTQDAHARLGFSDEQMAQWFKNAGLTMSDVKELTGRELTVKLWLGTRNAAAGLRVVGA